MGATDTPDAQRIAVTVRRLRAERGWTQRQLADRAELHVRTVQYVEAGKTAYGWTYGRIAQALGVPLDDITGEVGVR